LIHDPKTHLSTCHCGAEATKHLRTRNWCGNVCDRHAEAVKRIATKILQEGRPIVRRMEK